MSGFDMGGMMNMLGGFQQKMQEVQANLGQTEVTGTAGGVVTVVATCDNQIKSVSIDDSVAEDKDLLEDLVRAATNEALRLAKEETARQMATLTAGLPIPPGMIPGL